MDSFYLKFTLCFAYLTKLTVNFFIKCFILFCFLGTIRRPIGRSSECKPLNDLFYFIV